MLTWVQTFGPLLADAAQHQACKLGTRWWCDKT